MPETRMVRKRSGLAQLRKLYAHKPIVATVNATTASSGAAADDVSPLIDPTLRRYLRKDITRTVLAVAFFLILFLILYLLQNSAAIQHAIAWVGSHTGF